MFVITLVGFAAAVCSLPGAIDPNSVCLEDANGFSTLDADSDADIPISLTISSKGSTQDAFTVVHPGTVGALTDYTATDGRYILACPQEAGKKTVQLTVSRPAYLTAFGAEWVQLFPKDSWSNTTNEYEPFSFNDFGAKIPLAEFRATSTGLTDDAANIPELHVFMEVKDEGDYEVKYGNPSLTSNEKWVAVEFKSTLLRVGDPWADCTDNTLAAPSYSVGSIMPVLFGGPNVNSVAQKAGLPSYDDVIAELSGVSVPVKVVLEVFNAEKTSYTSSAVDSQCYKAGPACPENHDVCKPEYCEMDVWAAIISGLKGSSSPGMVTVLGSVDSSTKKSDYDDLDMDGFYLVETDVTTPALRRNLASPPAGNLKTEHDDNKCMDYNYNDDNVYMHSCHAGNNQQWVFTGQDGAGMLTTLHDDKCLDYNFNTGNVYMLGCHGGNNQLWHINPDGSMGTSHDSKCLDFKLDGSNNVYMHDCHGGANQIWVHPQRTQNAALAAGVATSEVPYDAVAALASCNSHYAFPTSELPKAKNSGFQRNSWEAGCINANEGGDVESCKEKCAEDMGCCRTGGCKSNSCSGGGCCGASRSICQEACESFSFADEEKTDDKKTDPLTTLQKFLSWKAPWCSLPASIDDVHLINVGDKRGHVLFYKFQATATEGRQHKIRSEANRYMEGTEYVDIPDANCKRPLLEV